MHIADILARDTPSLSFEFFPPKSDAGWESLYR
jgi:5,10-methylenetetrahydrofolate reductase